MQKAILTLSKNTSLIEQIRSNLEEGGRYYVQGVTSAHGSLAMVRHRMFDVAILDLDESDLTATQLVYNLKKIQPEIKILIYAPDSSTALAEINELPIDGILKKPFFAPELSDILKNLFKPQMPEDMNFGSESLQKSIAGHWEQLPEDSLEEMSHLLSNTSAVSCMIFHKGELVSQSAGFPTAEGTRIIDYIANRWKTFKNYEICRFMQSDGKLEAQLAYALSLGGDSLLVFTYPAAVDLRTIRREASKVRDAYMIGRYSKPTNYEPDHAFSYAELFGDEGLAKESSHFGELSDLDTIPEPLDADQASWILEFDDIQVNAEPAAPDASQDPLADTQPVPVRKARVDSNEMTTNPAAATAKETLPDASNEVRPKEVVEKKPPEDEAITYHCLIVPRDSSILLTQKLGEVSSTLIREIHLAQGWTLVHLTVRPLYILWTVRLPAGIKPAKVVDVVKDSTMRQLGVSFPDQVSTDASFWAPGYWILSGDQPPTGRLIEQFLKFRSQKSSDSPNM